MLVEYLTVGYAHLLPLRYVPETRRFLCIKTGACKIGNCCDRRFLSTFNFKSSTSFHCMGRLWSEIRQKLVLVVYSFFDSSPRVPDTALLNWALSSDMCIQNGVPTRDKGTWADVKKETETGLAYWVFHRVQEISSSIQLPYQAYQVQENIKVKPSRSCLLL